MRKFHEFMALSFGFKLVLIVVFCLGFYVTHNFLIPEFIAFWKGGF